MTFAAGELIGDRYRLEELIGSGGMGDVFRARDTLLERPVALKLVDVGDPRKREEITQSFLREARISAAIAHPNVVQILDFGTHTGTIPYIVMELLEGESLADVLGRGEKLPFDTLMEILDGVLEGLAAAHDAGVVHRDLKPENIYLARTKGVVQPKILDFGISKVMDKRGAAQITTTHGHVVGTPAYMSPEQARGVKFIDKRTDLYSMGVVIYELLSGVMPFSSENPGDLMVMIVTRPALPLCERMPEMPKALSDVVARAMQKGPGERFADAREMQRALRTAAAELRASPYVHELDARRHRPSWRMRSVAPTAGDPSLGGNGIPITGRVSLPLRLRSKRQIAAALSIALGAGALIATVVLFSRSSAAPAPHFIVVQANTPSEAESDPAHVAATPPDPSVTPMTHREPGSAPTSGASTPAPRKSDPAARLAESFRRQKAAVVACVNQHAEAAERTPKLSVRVALDASGHVQSARVQPPSVSASALGECIEGAVEAMQFPTQAGAIAFEVPLTTRKEE